MNELLAFYSANIGGDILCIAFESELNSNFSWMSLPFSDHFGIGIFFAQVLICLTFFRFRA